MAVLIWFVPLRLFIGIAALLLLACMSYIAAYKQYAFPLLLDPASKLCLSLCLECTAGQGYL